MDKRLERALRRAIALLEKHGYRYAVVGGIAYQFWGYARLTVVVDTVIGKTIVDFLLAMPGYEENIFTRAVRRDIGGFKIWICSAEDLIIQKAIAHRVKDWLDVEGVLVTQENNLDFDYIEDWIKQFADLLEEREIFEKYRETRDNVRAILAKQKKK